MDVGGTKSFKNKDFRLYWVFLGIRIQQPTQRKEKTKLAEFMNEIHVFLYIDIICVIHFK